MKLTKTAMAGLVSASAIQFSNAEFNVADSLLNARFVGDNVLSEADQAKLRNFVLDDLNKIQADNTNDFGDKVLRGLIATASNSDRLPLTSVSDSWLDYFNKPRSVGDGSPKFFECDNCYVFFNFEAITNYGCWCLFNSASSSLSQSPGGPVADVVDNECKDLQLCYKCAKIDAREEGTAPCAASTEPYEFEVSFNFFDPANLITMTCGNNEDTCSERACLCDADFIMTLLNNGHLNANYNENSRHENNFDFDGICITGDSTGPAKCCGEYPTRKPYNSNASNNVQCCNNSQLFNADISHCCASGPMGLGELC